ncbi:MAG: response regulator transcription factor [Thermodesulfobacteriota bacterium]
MAAVRILVIDDDAELCELLADYLGSEGFSVVAAHDAESGLSRALEGQASLVVLDVMLPGMSGFELLRRLRERSRVPVVMLTARGDDVDRIVGLEMGADDYLPKPFNPRELVARIRAVLRRGPPASDPSDRAPPPLSVGDLELDPATRVVRQGGRPVELTSVEFSLLEALVRAAGTVVPREALAEAALGRKLSAYDRSVDVHVSSLRRKLGPRVGELERIKPVRGVGYLYALTRPGEG